MANSCGYCGAIGEGGRFCSSCGQPMAGATPSDATLRLPETPVAPPAQVPPSQQPPVQQQARPGQFGPGQFGPGQFGPGQYGPAQPPGPGLPGAPTAAPRAPLANPFLGVPVADYVRDAAAAFCLFAALGMPWDALSDGGDRWWVIISVLLSLGSLALPYVGRARVVPGWTPQHVRLFKLAANVPFLACVVAAVINELANADDLYAGGLGTGIAMGLAGALLAAQPRAADEDRSPRGDRPWILATTVVGIAAVAVGVLTFLAFLLDDLTGEAYLLDDALGLVRVVLVSVVMFAVVVGWPVVASLGGSAAWRRVLAVVALTVPVVALFSLSNDGWGLFVMPRYEVWNSPAGGTFLIGALAALAVSRPQQRHTDFREEPVTAWIATASCALLVSTAALGLSALTLLLSMIDVESFPASHIVLLVMMVGSAGLAAFALTRLSDVRRNRPLVLGLLGGLLLLSVISLAVNDSQDIGFFADGLASAMWFSLPGLALYALTVPRPVRSALGPLITPSPDQDYYPPASGGQA